jgi:serine phosphatase RsbU (regulator of sigma subunit)
MANACSVLLVMDAASTQTDARLALEQGRHAVRLATFGAAEAAGGGDAAEVVVVDSSGAVEQAAEFCRRWRERQADTALVWLADGLAGRMSGWQAGAAAVLTRPLTFGELPAQVNRLTEESAERRRLAARAGESSHTNQTLLQLYQQNDADYRIARRIQRLCRPAQLPAVGRARFAVSHRERLGSAGDFYNVLRVDEDRVALFLGDVVGQSLTACMLAVFIHQNIACKEITGQTYRVLPPEEVMNRLGRSLAMLGMPDPPLVRMTYGLLDCARGDLTFACAGQSPPLHLPKDGPAKRWQAVGPLLAPGDVRLTAQAVALAPGDRVLLFTDGLHGAAAQQFDLLLAAVAQRRTLPLAGFVESVTQDLLTQTAEPDDFTLVGLEMEV